MLLLLIILQIIVSTLHGVGRADLHGYLAGGPQVTQHDLDQAPETADHKVQH
jgi:hypothetical protein